MKIVRHQKMFQLCILLFFKTYVAKYLDGGLQSRCPSWDIQRTPYMPMKLSMDESTWESQRCLDCLLRT